jgi:SnoaL-like polyketide cyclase
MTTTDWRSTTSRLDRHRSAYPYWNNRQFDAIAAIFEPVFDYYDHEREVKITTTAQMKKYAEELWSSFSDMQIDDRVVYDAGEGWTVSRCTIHGTNDGPLMGHPPSGKKVAVDFCEWIHWTDKLTIDAGHMYVQMLPLLRQLGFGPPKQG